MTEWSQRESTARSNTGEELKGHFQIFKSDNFYSVPKAIISVEKWCQTCRQNARWEGWCSLCTRPCRRSPSWAVNLLQPRVKDTLTSLQLLMKINWSYQTKLCHCWNSISEYVICKTSASPPKVQGDPNVSAARPLRPHKSWSSLAALQAGWNVVKTRHPHMRILRTDEAPSWCSRSSWHGDQRGGYQRAGLDGQLSLLQLVPFIQVASFWNPYIIHQSEYLKLVLLDDIWSNGNLPKYLRQNTEVIFSEPIDVRQNLKFLDTSFAGRLYASWPYSYLCNECDKPRSKLDTIW